MQWRSSVTSGTVDELWAKPECTTAARFKDLKFSDEFVDQFLRPLFAGITLDPELFVSSRFAEFVFRMLSQGFGAVPLGGMGELAAQLVDRLEPGTLRLSTPVESVTASTVRTSGGETVESDAVIVATDMTTSSTLAETPAFEWNGFTTHWFSSDAAPYTEPLLFLNGTREGPINNVAVISNVSPKYAPAGKHLTAVSVPGPADAGADLTAIQSQLRGWFGGAVKDWELLRSDVIAQALSLIHI